MRHTFTIPGTPFAKQRPRMTRGGRVYTPQETVRFEDTVRQLAAINIKQPLSGPVQIMVYCAFACPPSWSAKKRAAHLGQPHTQRPDLDNLMKAVCDGMNRVAYDDDGQIAQMTAIKVWAETAETVVTVGAINGNL